MFIADNSKQSVSVIFYKGKKLDDKPIVADKIGKGFWQKDQKKRRGWRTF